MSDLQQGSLVCLVCGAPDARIHYGGLVCPCCRVFFLRQTRRQQKQAFCKDNNQCVMRLGAHNNCKACRYRRCLAIGMRPREVDRYSKAPQPEVMAVAVLKTNDIRLSMDRIKYYASAGFKFIERLKASATSSHFSRELIRMETSIHNPEGAVPAEMYANVGGSLADVLLNSQICCPRDCSFLGNWKEEERDYNSLRFCHCRSIVKYIDFVTALQDIHNINGPDKLKMIQENYLSTMTLTYFYNVWNRTLDPATLRTRTAEYKLADAQQQLINVLVRGLFPLKEQICQKLDELSLNHEELVLLKCISVFVTGVGYPDNALVPIIQARTKYSILLSELIQERFPQMPLSDRMRRLTDSLGLLQLSKRAADISLQVFRQLFAANADGLAGNLTYDLYLREY